MPVNIKPIVIDNVIPKSLQEDIKEQLKYQAMWYYCPSASGAGTKVDTNPLIQDGPQMVHGLIHENQSTSPLSNLAFTISNHIERYLDTDIKNVIRVKANLLLRDSGSFDLYHPPHMDVPNNDCVSAVYYVEDSDGETLIFNKTVEEDPYNLAVIDKVEPKQGRVAIFPSKIFHASQNPVLNDSRTIINFILQIDRAKIIDTFGI